MIQDNQFAALGLVLIAETARVYHLIGAELDDVPNVLESTFTSHQHTSTAMIVGTHEDTGEAVDRPDSSVVSAAATDRSSERAEVLENNRKNHEQSQSMLSTFIGPNAKSSCIPDASSNPRQTRKRKKGNAIDVLFQALD